MVQLRYFPKRKHFAKRRSIKLISEYFFQKCFLNSFNHVSSCRLDVSKFDQLYFSKYFAKYNSRLIIKMIQSPLFAIYSLISATYVTYVCCNSRLNLAVLAELLKWCLLLIFPFLFHYYSKIFFYYYVRITDIPVFFIRG